MPEPRGSQSCSAWEEGLGEGSLPASRDGRDLGPNSGSPTGYAAIRKPLNVANVC